MSTWPLLIAALAVTSLAAGFAARCWLEIHRGSAFCDGCSGGEWTWMRRADEAEAKVAAVAAELERRQECAKAERAAGRSCDYCEDFIPEIKTALAASPAEPTADDCWPSHDR